MLLFNPSKDLKAIQDIFKADATILNLLKLTGKSQAETVKKIIRKSQWDNLATGERRLCVYFRPARRTSNQSFTEDVIQVDCHVPAADGIFAYQVLERVQELLHEKKINNRYLYYDGQLGELPTMPGFFCCGSRYVFNRKI